MLKEGQDQSPRPRDDEGHNQLWKTRLISSDSIFFLSQIHIYICKELQSIKWLK